MAYPRHRHHKSPLAGGARLNLPEFLWLASCPIVTDYFLFKFLKSSALWIFTCDWSWRAYHKTSRATIAGFVIKNF